jgi:hypothetical protein
LDSLICRLFFLYFLKWKNKQTRFVIERERKRQLQFFFSSRDKHGTLGNTQMVDKRAEKGKKKIQTSRAAIERDCRTSSSTPRHPLKKNNPKRKKKKTKKYFRNSGILCAHTINYIR